MAFVGDAFWTCDVVTVLLMVDCIVERSVDDDNTCEYDIEVCDAVSELFVVLVFVAELGEELASIDGTVVLLIVLVTLVTFEAVVTAVMVETVGREELMLANGVTDVGVEFTVGLTEAVLLLEGAVDVGFVVAFEESAERIRPITRTTD